MPIKNKANAPTAQIAKAASVPSIDVKKFFISHEP
jgi:hypothetical protein